MNKTAFVISIVLTTFVLMAFGGIVYALRAPEAATATESVAEPVTAESAVTPETPLEQVLLEREAIYQQRIAEANARLEQAQAQLAAQSGLAAQPAAGQALAAPITPEQAAQIVAEVFRQNVAWVEIVSLQGVDTYLVTLTSGELVYVDMNGQIVGSAPAQFTSGSSSGGQTLTSLRNSGGSGGEHEGEHEDDHEEEHEDD